MENFFYGDYFCDGIEDLLERLDIDADNVNDLPEDYTEEIEHTTEEKIFTVELNIISDVVMSVCEDNEDRFPEDSDSVDKKITNAIKASVAKLNELLPSLHYMNGIKETFTKSDFVNFCK